jgi:predicted Zn-dependent protease with MMP-like domain
MIRCRAEEGSVEPAMISIDAMNDLLDDIAQEIPQDFFNELNGEIILLPDRKMHPQAIGNDLYILGEYHRSSTMGRYIAVYYGSVKAVYGSLDENQLRPHLKDLLLHEFTHHIESMAGERGLEIKDAQSINRYMDRKNKYK